MAREVEVWIARVRLVAVLSEAARGTQLGASAKA
jgi:hypothetical protein